MTNESEVRQLAGTADAGAEEGPRLAGYEIVEEIGRGKMGVVYRARQQVLQRTVALKVMAGREVPAEYRARLCAGVEAAARLSHPNIVQIYEFGEDKGRLFFSMELIDGWGLNKVNRGNPWPTNTAAEFIETLARAMHFAHERGIVHGDLKPTNVLVEGYEELSIPGESGEQAPHSAFQSRLAAACPKITDLGVAKQLAGGLDAHERDSVTEVHSYTAPEEIRGPASAVGPATDVYALGAMLYELVTGHPPYQGLTPQEIADQVCRIDPVPPSRLRPTLPPEISTICLTCLKKNPWKRYATAEDLADDLRRYLTGKAIAARSSTAWERTKKWMRDRPTLALLTILGAILAAILFVVIVTTNTRLSAERNESLRLKMEADRLRQLDQTQIATLQRQMYDSKLRDAWQAWDRGQLRRVQEELRASSPKNVHDDFRGFEWHCLWNLSGGSSRVFTDHTASVRAIAFGANSSVVFSGSDDGTIRLWSIPGRTNVASLRDGDAAVCSLTLSPDESWLASGHSDGVVRVWDVRAQPPLLMNTKKLSGPESKNMSPTDVFVAVNGDGTKLAAASSDGRLRVLLTTTLNDAVSVDTAMKPGRRIGDLSLSKDAKMLAVSEGGVGEPSQIKLWDVESGAPGRVLEDPSPEPLQILFLPADNLIAGAGQKGGIRIWNYHTGELQRQLVAPDSIDDMVIDSLSGRWLAVGYGRTHQFGAVDLLDLQTGETVDRFMGHSDPVLALAFSSNGKMLATGNSDGAVRLYDVPAQPAWWMSWHDAIWSLDLSPDNNRLAIGARNAIRIVDAGTGNVASEYGTSGRVTGLRFMPDGKTLVSLEQMSPGEKQSSLGRPKMWNLETGTQREWSLAGSKNPPASTDSGSAGLSAFAISADGDKFLAATSRNTSEDMGKARYWSLDGTQHHSEKTLPDAIVTSVDLSDDGVLAAIGGGDNGNTSGVGLLWNVANGQEVATLRNASMLHCLVFSRADTRPDKSQPASGKKSGELLATGWGDNAIRLWSTSHWQQLATMDGHRDTPTCLAFAPDGTRLASGSLDHTVKLWDLETFKEVATLSHRFPVRSVRFTRNGNTLVVGCADESGKGELRFWHAGQR